MPSAPDGADGLRRGHQAVRGRECRAAADSAARTRLAETTELLKKARALLAEGRDGLAWFKGDALGLLDRVVPENFDELQDEMATPWLAVYESELFQLVVGSAGGRLIHRVARTTPEPFRSLREGLDWLRATYASFLEDAVTLLDEFAHRLGKALTDANSQD